MSDDQPTPSTDDQLRYNGIILEDVQHQVKRLAEAMADVPATVKSIDQRLTVVEQDMKVVKAAVTDTSKQVADHENRITVLETV